MSAKGLVVNGYSERWLRRGFPWVYRKEIQSGGGRAGSERVIRSGRGEVLGRGILDDGWIGARVFRHDEGPLDAQWLERTLDTAAALREVLITGDTTAYRLIHGENDGLPGIRVDWWHHFATLILDSPSLARFVDGIVHWLDRTRSPRGVILCYRQDPRDDRDFSHLNPAPGLRMGHAPTGPVRVQERGLHMDVYPMEAPDVGMYADMREVRARLEPHWGGTSVLNTFAYTGAFSVAAAVNGASEVVSVDLSAKFLARAEDNFRANGLDPSAHEFVTADTFKALDRFRRTGRTFDRVILDPPSFSRSAAGVWSAKKDYPRLVAAACRVLAPDGWLIAASNQGEVSPREFSGFVADGVSRAKRRSQLLWWVGQAPDFPAGSWFPEGRYLKVAILRMVG